MPADPAGGDELRGGCVRAAGFHDRYLDLYLGFLRAEAASADPVRRPGAGM